MKRKYPPYPGHPVPTEPEVIFIDPEASKPEPEPTPVPTPVPAPPLAAGITPLNRDVYFT